MRAVLPRAHESRAPQGAFHDGHHYARDRVRPVRRIDRLRGRLRPSMTGVAMFFDYSLAGLVTVGLMIYLAYALLRPEQL